MRITFTVVRVSVALVLATITACSSESSSSSSPGSNPAETPAAAGCGGPCASGVCDPKTNTCVDAWVVECAGVDPGTCGPNKPYVCAGAEPPSYDCTKCGCGDAASCVEGVCLPQETQSLVRQNGGLPTNLDIDAYFAFLDSLRTSEALSFTAAVDEILIRMRADRRRVMLSLGESHGSDDEQAIGVELVRALAQAGFRADRIGIEGGDDPILDPKLLGDLDTRPLAITGDLTNKAYCKAAVAQVGGLLNDEGMYVQYTGSGHTSQEACYHPEHYSICSPPHTAECVTKTGRKAITVNLFDPDPWLGMTDTALLWRAGERLPDVAAFERELEAALAAWKTHVGAHAIDPTFAATPGGRAVNVRFVASSRFDDVWTAFFPRPAREPFISRSFKAVWSVDALKKHLVDNAIRPQECSISWDLSVTTPGTEKYWVHCEKGGKSVDASLDPEFVVKSSSTQ